MGACATGALTVGAVALTVAAGYPHAAVQALLLAAAIMSSAGIGLIVLARRPHDRFARLLVATGLASSTIALTQAASPVAYSASRIMLWLLEFAFLYLVLSFPSGRLGQAPERRLFALGAALLLSLWIPTGLVVSQYPLPTPWVSCGGDCPSNAFQLTASQPAVIDALVRPLREVLTLVLWFAVLARLIARVRGAGPLRRRTLIPVVATVALRSAVMCGWFIARAIDPHAGETLLAIGWLYMFSLPAIAIGFGTGLLLRRLYAAIALRRFLIDLPPHPTPVQVRTTLAATLQDPTLRIFSCETPDGRWIDEDGAPVPAPQCAPGSAVTDIAIDGERVAAIVHHESLAQDRVMMRAAGTIALTVIENAQLVGRLRSSLHRLSESRARTAAVADETRRRIERDLHDGAQQRLVALRIRLSTEAERLHGPDRQNVAALGDDVEQTIDELRRLAHGIYPSALTDRGLAAALSTAALTAPIPTSVRTTGSKRYRPEVESAVYFACMEAMQNSAKHAGPGAHVEISLRLDEILEFEVRDDGAGFQVDGNDGAAGAGLTNLHDRLSAVGGRVVVESAPGHGTRVTGAVPAAGRPAEPATPDAIALLAPADADMG